MYYLLLFAIFALKTFVQAEEPALEEIDPFTSSLTNTQSLIATLTNGSVSVITGDWVEAENDFAIEGPERLTLGRLYVVGRHQWEDKPLKDFWVFNRLNSMRVSCSKDEIDNEHYCNIHFRNDHGSYLSYHKDIRHEKSEEICPLLKHTRGLTNCALGAISARTNLHNTKVAFSSRSVSCTVKSGSGEITYFSRPSKESHKSFNLKSSTCYLKPRWQRKASGRCFEFYEDRIFVRNPDKTLTYGWLKYQHPNDKQLLITASNGQAALYEFTPYPEDQDKTAAKAKRRSLYFDEEERPQVPQTPQAPKEEKICLSKVTYTHKPSVCYQYADHQLRRKDYPDSRFIETTYYTAGDHEIAGLFNLSVKKEEDPRLFRVKAQRAPVGPDATPIITYQFVYDIDSKKRKAHFAMQGVYKGKTDVYDALLHRTSYHYNTELRPIRIQKFTGNRHHHYKLYAEEEYLWDYRYLAVEPQEGAPKLPLGMTNAAFLEEESVNSFFFETNKKPLLETLTKIQDSSHLEDRVHTYAAYSPFYQLALQALKFRRFLGGLA